MGPLANAKLIAIVGTADREKAKPFYRDTLGLTLKSEDRFAAVFELGGITLRLSPIPNFQAHNHTVVGFEVADIETRVKELSARGVKFNIYEGFGQDASGIWTAPDKDARVAWFNDTDGNVLSLTQF
jgi:predicted enzyme related to lactoylglutathione lyase